MKQRILVVENNQTILELIGIVLEDAGYEVKLYTTEKAILSHIINFQPDAILLDIFKPTIEGTELCRQLKEAQSTAHIPVIVLSTHPQIAKVKEICADEIVPKPFDIDGLLDVLKDQLKTAS
ncbi:MAG: response regulator [Pedobacter sp.]|nr:response regulator [Pedobacter sp.]MDQ8052028.1 response regulator [Pedobacter sp.]